MWSINENLILRNGIVIAAVNNGELSYSKRVRIPIHILREANVNDSIIEQIREDDRRHERGRRHPSHRRHRSIAIDSGELLNYTYGIEIECFHKTNANIKRDVVEKLRAVDVSINIESYNHRDSATSWKIVTDSSIRGQYSFEIVSPILKGAEGMEQVKKVCTVLNELGCVVNKSCGLHVHHQASDLSDSQIRNVFKMYRNNELLIDELMPYSRKANNNSYCHTLRNISTSEWKTSRYYKLNYCSYARHNTIEFRHHSGTINFEKISNWIRLTQRMLRNATDTTYDSLESMLNALNIANVNWYLERAEEFAA